MVFVVCDSRHTARYRCVNQPILGQPFEVSSMGRNKDTYPQDNASSYMSTAG